MRFLITHFFFAFACVGVQGVEAYKATALGITGQLDGEQISEFHVFASETTSVDIAIEAPLGSKLSLLADVTQITSGIAARLSEGVSLGAPQDFSNQTRQVIQAKIPLPKIERMIELLVKIRTAGESDTKTAQIGLFRLFVYPADGMKELAGMFSSGGNKTGAMLGVFGAGKNIRAFLEDQKIPFTDLGEGVPEEFRADVIYVGEAKSEEITARLKSAPAARVVFFNEENAPGIYRTTTPEGSVTKITFPILDSLSSNPVSQKIFTDTIFQSIQPTQ